MPNLEGRQLRRHHRKRPLNGPSNRARSGREAAGTGHRRGHNPFVLVNYSSTICLNPPSDLWHGGSPGRSRSVKRRDTMLGPLKPKSDPTGSQDLTATRRTALGLMLGAPLLSACAGVQQSLSQFSSPFGETPTAPAGPAQQPTAVGNGQVKVGLILPLSASGNAGVAAQSMKNAAEMALAEFQNPEHPAPDQGRCRQPARRAAGRATGGRRRRRDHPRPAVRAVGAGGRAGRAHPRHFGDRVLDRFQHRRPRRLSVELPAGVRRQPHRRLLREHRQEILRRAAAGQRLWQCGGGCVQDRR